jgi:RNA polymerase sigma factor (sigma-70 family)
VTRFHDQFVELYDAHFPRVLRFLDRLSGDPTLASDIAQDAFVRLYRRGAPPDRPAAWLITVALNLLRNRRSTDARRSRLLTEARAEAALADPSRRPDEVVESADLRKRVRTTLARLPERDRQLLLLRSEGYRYEELAEALGLNRASVGVLLARAKRAFRAAYEELGGGASDAS